MPGSMAEAMTMAVSTISTMSRKNHSNAARMPNRNTLRMLPAVIWTLMLFSLSMALL